MVREAELSSVPSQYIALPDPDTLPDASAMLSNPLISVRTEYRNDAPVAERMLMSTDPDDRLMVLTNCARALSNAMFTPMRSETPSTTPSTVNVFLSFLLEMFLSAILAKDISLTSFESFWIFPGFT